MRGMRWVRALGLTGLAIGATAPWRAAVAQPEASGVHIHVMVNGQDSPPPRPLRAMMAEAEAIWRPHAVRLILSSGQVGADDERLELRFGSATGASRPMHTKPRGGTGLGAIRFNEDGSPAPAITVSPDAVAAVIRLPGTGARALEWGPPALAEAAFGRALGRVLAHEIGHYLLASPAHAPVGLMRAVFNGRQLADMDRRTFELDPMALPRLRARLARLERAP